MIFTIDAIIALGIFLSSTILFYSFFTDAGGFGLRAPNLYSAAGNYFGSYDSNAVAFGGVFSPGVYSFAVYQYQNNNFASAEETLQLVVDTFEFPANARISVWNKTKFDKVIEVDNNLFEDKLSIKRYLVLDFNQGLETFLNEAEMLPVKILAGESTNYEFTLNNPNPTDADVTIELIFSNSTDSFDYVSPVSRTLTVPGGSATNTEFTITIPQDAIIGTYYLTAHTTGDFEDISNTTVSIIYFGLLEVETGYGS